MMSLKIFLASEVLVDEKAMAIRAEGRNGSFGLLPRHIDFVTALTPGILSFVDEKGKEIFVAVDGGVLVKTGKDVRVSTRHGVRGSDLGKLEQMVQESFRALDEREKMTQSAMARLVADFIRELVETEVGGGRW